MTNINDYLTASKDATGSVETTKRRVRQAYDKAQEGLQKGNYDRLDNLENDVIRSNFKKTLISELTKPLQKSINSMPEDLIFAEALGLRGFYGIDQKSLSDLIDNQKGDLKYETYTEFLNKHTEFNKTLGIRAQVPFSVLDQVPVNDVFTYVGVTPKDPSKASLEERASLVNQYDRLGIVPPKFLKGKPYM